MWMDIKVPKWPTYKIVIKTHFLNIASQGKPYIFGALSKTATRKFTATRAAFATTAIFLIAIFPTNSINNSQFTPLRHTCPATPCGYLCDMNNGLYRTMASSCELTKAMADWSFSDPTLASLPLDSELRNYVRRNVPKVVFSQVRPTPLQKPRKLVAVSSEALRDILDMDPDEIQTDPDFVDFISGNNVLKNSIPLAHRYGGHQFGGWAGQLGDGRAHLLGEYVNSKGDRWELQLKGSGKTPYSRFGDGRAVLRSSIREFLCAEAMYHLGVPTSRAAALVVSDDEVVRDIFYDGHAKMERCAVVLRLAPTWFRMGSLQILSSHAEIPELRKLLKFIIDANFKHLLEIKNEENRIFALYNQVVRETAEMIAHWTSVGFVHGVMNTDNLSLLSITIDYGPFGFLDSYDDHYTPNHSDDGGRYDYQSQPEVAKWNLKMLAQALMPLVDSKNHKQFVDILGGYDNIYQEKLLNIHREKFGLKKRTDKDGNSLDTEDKRLAEEWISCMRVSESDYTQSWRDLSEISLDDLKNDKCCLKGASFWALDAMKLKAKRIFKSFVKLYVERLQKEDLENYEDSVRMEHMQKANPRYILRQWMAQSAILKAEKDDFSEVRSMLKVLSNPYQIQKEAESAGYANPVPGWSKELVVSCSS
jgi:uncharacterized protein YdiU (UPF0061 family)